MYLRKPPMIFPKTSVKVVAENMRCISKAAEKMDRSTAEGKQNVSGASYTIFLNGRMM